MLRLLRFLFWIFALVAIWYFATTYPIGKYTLWGHLKRIWNSQETKDFVNSAEETGKKAVDGTRRSP